jgi:uncharacterized protein YjbJ (UPF0337 family)
MKMDWNRVEGNWKQVKGKVKEQWGKLTDDDLDVINGKQDQLEGRLQQRYGYAKDQATKEVNDWYGRQKWRDSNEDWPSHIEDVTLRRKLRSWKPPLPPRRILRSWGLS